MEKLYEAWSRRKFLYTLTGTGGLLLLNPLSSWAADEPGKHADTRTAGTIGIDAYNRIDVPLNASELPDPSVNLSYEMKNSGLSALCMSFSIDYQKLSTEGEAYDRFNNGMDAMDALLESNNIKRSLTLADLQEAHSNHIPAIIQSVEGAHFLEGHLERLTAAYNRGVRHLTLLHDTDTFIHAGDHYTYTPQWGGLTAFGADVIKECNRLGILIDLAHANNETLDAALKIIDSPAIISHTGLNTQLGQNEPMSKMLFPRLISKDQAKAVADTGGLIGVWTHLADTPLQYAENIRALVDVVGIDHVCIGTDTKLTPAYSISGHSAERIEKCTNNIWEGQGNGFYHVAAEALSKTGFTKDEIAKIGGGNFCRVFDTTTKKNI